MKKGFILSVLILIILFITALNTGFVKENKTGNIAGIVVCEGHPVSDAWVSVLGIKTTTDSTGRFFISGISPRGGYTVMAGGDRYIESFVSDVHVRPDSTTVIVFYLEYLPLPRRHAEIIGILKADSTSFLKMDYKQIAKLDLPKVEHPSGKREEKIIGDSIIEIPGPPLPEVPVELSQKQMRYTPVEETRPGNIAGVVYSGVPLPGGLVIIRRLSGEWEETTEFKDVRGNIESIKQKTIEKIAYTDSSGRYFFSGIEPGEYEMYARGESGLYKTETFEWGYDYKMTKAKGIKVAPDSTSIVNFGLVPGLLLVEPPLIEHEDAIIVCDSSCFYEKSFKEILYVQPVTKDLRYKTGNIAGVAGGENVKGIYVYIPYTGLTSVKSATTDSLGRYFIEGLKPGIYEINAEGTMGGGGIEVIATYTTIVNFSVLPNLGAFELLIIPHPIIWNGAMIKCDKKCFFKKSPEEIIKLETKYLNKKPREYKK
jgi:hypothetical protein